MKINQNQAGFVAIVVLAVVAAVIAGVAYLMFAADSDTAGDTASNNSDTQRQQGVQTEEVTAEQLNDIARLKSGINSFSAENNGRLPNSADISTIYEDSNLQTYAESDIKLFEFPNFRDDVPANEVHIVTGAACGVFGTKTVLENGGRRSFAVIAGSDNTFICE